MTEDVCGSTDTHDGTPCQNEAGLGTESDIGPCFLHPADGTYEGDTGGRPSKFTDERARAAIDAARNAKSLTGAARAAGVHHTTIANWLEKDPTFVDKNGDEAGFFAALTRARAEAETLLTRGALTRPDEINPSHARFLLKTSFDYQETDRLEIDDITPERDRVDLDELRDVVGDIYD